MISEELQKKIDRAIKLLKSVNGGGNEVIEIAYSGGKDSDVILQLAKEAEINYEAIYRNTTIDPSGTINHVREMGATVLPPREGMSFFKLVERYGLPNRFRRFCCYYLKEYKVYEKSVMGIRKSESRKRNERYSEPTECKFYGNKKEHVEAIYPILDWTDDDVRDFILDRKIKCAPVYYKNGEFDVKQRLGCIGCPLIYPKTRVKQLQERPSMVKAYVRAFIKYWDAHPDTKTRKIYQTPYEQIVRDFFYENSDKWDSFIEGMFGRVDCKKFLEDYFHITL